jgi:hypothetical protein
MLTASGHRLPADTLTQSDRRRRDILSTIFAAIANEVPGDSMLLESKAQEIASMIFLVLASYLQRPLDDDTLDSLIKKEGEAFVAYANFFVIKA